MTLAEIEKLVVLRLTLRRLTEENRQLRIRLATLEAMLEVENESAHP